MRTSLLLFLLSLTFLDAGATPQETCPIQGITTTSFGAGTPQYGPNQLTLAWDASTCSLTTKIDAFPCCNVFLTQHYLLISPSLQVSPRLLGPPFLAGSTLYLGGSFVSSALLRDSGSVPIPPDPALVGSTFLVQAVPVYFGTIPLPPRMHLATTQGVVLTFR